MKNKKNAREKIKDLSKEFGEEVEEKNIKKLYDLSIELHTENKKGIKKKSLLTK